MPTNTYRCKTCHDQRDTRRDFHAPHPSICAICGGDLRQVYHSFSLRIRGHNWKSYSVESSVRSSRHQAAIIGEDELEK